jgi:rhamnose transport system permease protein
MSSSLIRRFTGWDAAVIALLVVFLVVASATVENFATGRNLSFLVLDLAPIALIALPMTLIIVTGEIDLSVASMLGLTSAVLGALWDGGLSIETIIPLCLVLGAVLGAVNGLFVTVFGLPSLAVTIGTLALYRGLAFVVLGDAAVAQFPGSYTAFVTGSTAGIPNLVFPLAVLALVFGLVLHATPVGRSLFAIGGGVEAARFTGVRVTRVKFWLYVVCGMVCALAGVLWTLRYASARADNGSGLELAALGSAGRGRPARVPAERAAPRRRLERGALRRHRATADRLGARAQRGERDPLRRRTPFSQAGSTPRPDPGFGIPHELVTVTVAGLPALLRGKPCSPSSPLAASRHSRSAPSSPSASPPAAAPPASPLRPTRLPAPRPAPSPTRTRRCGRASRWPSCPSS